MHKKIFISVEGILGLEKMNDGDILASSYDLLESLCMGEEEIHGILSLSDGVFMFYSNFGDEEAINCVGELCEYIKIGEVEEAIPIKIDTKHRTTMNKNLLVASLIICGIFSYIL